MCEKAVQDGLGFVQSGNLDSARGKLSEARTARTDCGSELAQAISKAEKKKEGGKNRAGGAREPAPANSKAEPPPGVTEAPGNQEKEILARCDKAGQDGLGFVKSGNLPRAESKLSEARNTGANCGSVRELAQAISLVKKWNADLDNAGKDLDGGQLENALKKANPVKQASKNYPAVQARADEIIRKAEALMDEVGGGVIIE
ncbi:hypothetical protein FACS1894158_06360 [Betaproteobacteria bacterium]|nr:hypothetical protein FACS1894158_06360 [Betaproteobacteria bacterium]